MATPAININDASPVTRNFFFICLSLPGTPAENRNSRALKHNLIGVTLILSGWSESQVAARTNHLIGAGNAVWSGSDASLPFNRHATGDSRPVAASHRRELQGMNSKFL